MTDLQHEYRNGWPSYTCRLCGGSQADHGYGAKCRTFVPSQPKPACAHEWQRQSVWLERCGRCGDERINTDGGDTLPVRTLAGPGGAA